MDILKTTDKLDITGDEYLLMKKSNKFEWKTVGLYTELKGWKVAKLVSEKDGKFIRNIAYRNAITKKEK